MKKFIFPVLIIILLLASTMAVSAAGRVDISNPIAGETIKGEITITGTVTTNQTIEYVEISFDGRNYLSCSGAGSWSRIWDTTKMGNSHYTINVRAVCGNNETYENKVDVYVDNPSEAVIASELEVIGIHATEEKATIWLNAMFRGRIDWRVIQAEYPRYLVLYGTKYVFSSTDMIDIDYNTSKREGYPLPKGNYEFEVVSFTIGELPEEGEIMAQFSVGATPTPTPTASPTTPQISLNVDVTFIDDQTRVAIGCTPEATLLITPPTTASPISVSPPSAQPDLALPNTLKVPVPTIGSYGSITLYYDGYVEGSWRFVAEKDLDNVSGIQTDERAIVTGTYQRSGTTTSNGTNWWAVLGWIILILFIALVIIAVVGRIKRGGGGNGPALDMRTPPGGEQR